MIKINLKLWYKDGSGKDLDLQRVVPYIPDQIFYSGHYWIKEISCVDLDEGIYTRVHYIQVIR